MSAFETIQKLGIDPRGIVFLEFASYDERADFLKLVPAGEVFANTRCNTDGPPWRLSWKLADFKSVIFVEERNQDGEETGEGRCPTRSTS